MAEEHADSSPQLRIDPVSGLRVIVAAARGERPGAWANLDPPPLIDPEADPFREGHEHQTPPELYALRPHGGDRDGPGWRVRVVPNLYPALAPGETDTRDPLAGGPGDPDLFVARAADGAHEVTVSTPPPGPSLHDLRPHRLALATGV